MSLFKFIHLKSQNKKIDLYNFGNHTRDFTYVDDVVEIVFKLMKKIPKKIPTKKLSEFESPAPWRIYNVSSSKPRKLKFLFKKLKNN